MPSDDLASRAPPARPAGEPGGPPGPGQVVPADREPGSRHNTLARSPAGDLTPETADRCPHTTPAPNAGLSGEAATQNAERLPAHHPQGSATMPRDHIATSDRIVRQGRLELARARTAAN